MDVNSHELARRVTLEVTIGGHSATSYMEPYLLSFEYTDHAAGKSDEIQVELHDRDDKWINGWLPRKGAAMTAALHCLNWCGPGGHMQLNCGAFKCDNPTYSGPPNKVSIKAVSASLTGPLRETARTQAWEGFSLQGVAQDIAQRNGLELFYDSEPHSFQRQDQRAETDLAFLQRLAEDRGVNLKVHNDKLVLFSAKDADARAAGLTITRKAGTQFSAAEYSFEDTSEGTGYAACTVQYNDPATNQLRAVTYNPGGKTVSDEQTNKVLVLDKRVESEADALKLAQNNLRGGNKGEVKGSFRIMGYPGLVAGMTVNMQDFGRFSGKYFVEKTTHSVSGKYTTAAEIRRVLGY